MPHSRAAAPELSRGSLKSPGNFSTRMVHCLLVAATDAAKTYQGLYGPDLFLSGNNKLGRNPVQTVGGYQLPQSWQQVSGNHCRLYCGSEVQCFIGTDSSMVPTAWCCTCCAAFLGLASRGWVSCESRRLCANMNLTLQAPEQWFLEDTSTNGTHLEKKRVKKNTSVPLAFGQRITLSCPQAGAPASTAIEYASPY